VQGLEDRWKDPQGSGAIVRYYGKTFTLSLVNRSDVEWRLGLLGRLERPPPLYELAIYEGDMSKVMKGGCRM
jgi:hypothetical protein